ncbi:beta-eliminating lyase-related protein [soil metagenome]
MLAGMQFASDNTSGVAPEVLAAIAAEGARYGSAYGDDEATRGLDARFAELFEHEVAVHPVMSGTAANSLALSCLTPPWGEVLCHEGAHIVTDEGGAPELFTGGARLVLLPGADGKIDPAALAASFTRTKHGVHSGEPSVLALTQATEAGTVYRADEIAALVDRVRPHGIRVHMDGARFANSMVHLGCSPAEATWRLGIDVLSFGATKNGCLGAEAVVFFDRALATEFERRRKRAGHLLSKLRFVSVQLEAYLADGLWLRNAAQANRSATRLADGLAVLDGVTIHSDVDANEIFAALPRASADRLLAAGARFYGEAAGDRTQLRLVTSFTTTDDEVDRFLAIAAGGDDDGGVGRQRETPCQLR